MNENTEVTEDTNGWPGALLICKLSMKGDLSSALFTMSEVRNRKKFLRPHRRDSGKARTGAALGLMITINAPWATLGTPIFGYIVDHTGSYAIAWQRAWGVSDVGHYRINNTAQGSGIKRTTQLTPLLVP